MRVLAARALLLLSLAGPGCMLYTATRVVTHRAVQDLDDARERHRNRRWAEQAWEQVKACSAPVAYSEDHASGFQEGFAHYLYTGLSEPPPVPPVRYRAVRYQTPEGYRAIEDWFAGYRHGVAVAEASGYRQWITGPSSLRSAGAPAVGPPVPDGDLGHAPPTGDPAAPPDRARGEGDRLGELPAPRVLPDPPPAPAPKAGPPTSGPGAAPAEGAPEQPRGRKLVIRFDPPW